MSKTIRVNVLSESSLKKAINELQQYEKRVIDKTQAFARRLAMEGVQYARTNIVNMDAVDTSELLNSITSAGNNFHQGAVFFIMATSSHAVFVEFGTGYIGKDIPYKGVFPDGLGWQYVSGSQVTANALKGIYGWFYVGKDGKVHFTAGMESRPFMWDTARELQANVEKIAKEVFGNG